MIKINMELDAWDFELIREGAKLLSQKLNYARELKGKSPLLVDEKQFLHLAITDCIHNLESEATCNEN